MLYGGKFVSNIQDTGLFLRWQGYGSATVLGTTGCRLMPHVVETTPNGCGVAGFAVWWRTFIFVLFVA